MSSKEECVGEAVLVSDYLFIISPRFLSFYCRWSLASLVTLDIPPIFLPAFCFSFLSQLTGVSCN